MGSGEEVLVDAYAESTRVRPVLTTLASAIPVLGTVVATVDATLMAHVEREREDRLQTLIQSLEEGLDDFSGPIQLYRAETVLHAAYVTIEATVRTSRREKIRAFGKLLLAGLEDPPRLELATEHEDYLKILDDLSIRELALLALLSEFEQASPKNPGESDVSWTARFWGEFEQQASDRLKVPQAELRGLMSRIIRTGTFEPFAGAIWDYEGGRGLLTPVYYRLASLIAANPGAFDEVRLF